jgi:hypothetical protein
MYTFPFYLFPERLELFFGLGEGSVGADPSHRKMRKINP